MKLLLVLAPLVMTRADFVLVDWATDWYTARDYCRENHVDLASIHSEEDNTAVTTACADMCGGSEQCKYYTWYVAGRGGAKQPRRRRRRRWASPTNPSRHPTRNQGSVAEKK